MLGDQKRRLLNVFLACNTIESPLWKKYSHLIANDMGLPLETESDEFALWEKIPQLMSFNRATEAPKLGRWFSWNTQAKEQLREFNAQKMVLESSFALDDPDEGTWCNVEWVCYLVPRISRASRVCIELPER